MRRPRYAELLERARHMRKNPTPEEARLWRQLRKRRLDGLKFRRQHILMPYIVDFYCASKAFAVEVDGEVHHEQTESDQKRDENISEAHGVTVIRIEAAVVRDELGRALEQIREAVGQTPQI